MFKHDSRVFTTSWIKNILVEIGSARFFNRLCTLVGDKAVELTEILKYRDISEMKKFVADNEFDGQLNELLLKLPTAFGDITLLDTAIKGINDEILLKALERLKELYNSLDNKESIIFDLGMVPTMKYYTGLMIKGYSDKSAQPIISGEDMMTYYQDSIKMLVQLDFATI